MTEQRRFAAIVSADVAGYSRLMGRDMSVRKTNIFSHLISTVFQRGHPHAKPTNSAPRRRISLQAAAKLTAVP